jgi:N utilization substance protein A
MWVPTRIFKSQNGNFKDEMIDKEFLTVVSQIAESKNISQDKVLEIVEAAIAAAYRKDYGEKEGLYAATLDPDSLSIRIFRVKNIVEEVVEPAREVSLDEALAVDKKAEIGGEIREEVEARSDFGRVAAQTAKQVVLQRLKEAERQLLFEEFQDKSGSLVNATVQQIEGDVVILDMGKATGILFPSEQSRSDRYYPGQRIKVYVLRVEESSREPHVVVSRSHPDMIKKLFEVEVPEIAGGVVEIKGIAREAGVRSKVAVHSTDQAVDPVGSMVGRRGVRVQAVMDEIGEEKIDIVLWNEDSREYIINALAPAQIKDLTLNEEDRIAQVEVNDDQLSLVIGKNGQNVRLASKLTGWQIDVKKDGHEQPSPDATLPQEEIPAEAEAAVEEVAPTEEAAAVESVETPAPETEAAPEAEAEAQTEEADSTPDSDSN